MIIGERRKYLLLLAIGSANQINAVTTIMTLEQEEE
jgi:hypothetical protein